MRKTIIDKPTFGFAVAAAFAALAAISCAKVSGGASSPAADDTASVASAPASGAAAPAPSTVSNVGTQHRALPVGTNPAAAPAPGLQGETPTTLPSPAVLQAVSAAQGKLDAVTAVLDGTKVRFVACDEGAACTARVEAQTLTGLRDLLRSVSAQQGGIGYVAREQLDGYTGHSYVADVTLGGPDTRPVPTDENALLVN
jgi:hypothetical protein